MCWRSLLSGIGIATIADALKACRWFHSKGVPTVVITSLSLQRSDSGSGSSDASDVIDIIASTTDCAPFARFVCGKLILACCMQLLWRES